MANTAERPPDVLRPTGKLLLCWERKKGPACVPVLGSEPLEGSHSGVRYKHPTEGTQ